MTPDQVAGIQLLASAILGGVWQWAAFAPKKIPNYLAWVSLGVVTALAYWWSNPYAAQQWQDNWRLSVFSAISFLLTAKGSGSSLKAIGLAPATNSK